MRVLLAVLSLFCAVFAVPTLDESLGPLHRHLKNWKDFKTTYSKQYETVEEEVKRFSIFVEHSLKVEKHNSEEAEDGRHGFETGINEFADLSSDEFVKLLTGLKRQPENDRKGMVFDDSDNKALPASVDWRPKGYVTPIKNQGQCGSCWAFSATGSLEGQHFKKTGKLVSLSEQQLVDCSGKYGNEGCNGGLMDQAFEYIRDNGGLDTEASYPYEAMDDDCRYKSSNVGATVAGYVDIPSKNEHALQKAVATVGPIAVAIDASQWSFQLYKRGVYNEPECSQDLLDHGVLVVGYGKQKKNAYWIVKNSWGTSWGQNGYIWMSRNKHNQCGIATDASYPKV